MSLWRIGLTSLLGALAGMVLFPRPAQGRRPTERDAEAAPEPACAAPDRQRR